MQSDSRGLSIRAPLFLYVFFRKCPSKYEIEVSVMPLSVASLATPQSIISHLRNVRLEDYDLVMVSGKNMFRVVCIGDSAIMTG